MVVVVARAMLIMSSIVDKDPRRMDVVVALAILLKSSMVD